MCVKRNEKKKKCPRRDDYVIMTDKIDISRNNHFSTVE